MIDEKYGDFFKEYDPAADNKREVRQPSYRAPKKRKKRKIVLKRLIIMSVALLITAVIIILCVKGCGGNKTAENEPHETVSAVESEAEHTSVTPKYKRAETDKNSVKLKSEINSKYALLIDDTNNKVLAYKGSGERIYPASMTKVMTVLVAAENVDTIDGMFKMTSAIIDPFYKAGATLAGFCPGETVRVEDLFYGTILESGAEAAYALAEYISGTEEEFVKLMNRKAEELGLENTHFCNVIGLQDKDHYTTCEDMAVIMQAAIKNAFCRKVLSTEYYTVAANDFHEEIKFHSTMFSRMYGTEPEVATILGGKTGFTSDSGNCLASFGVTDDGRTIICITADGEGRYKPIYDCIDLYKEFTHPGTKSPE